MENVDSSVVKRLVRHIETADDMDVVIHEGASARSRMKVDATDLALLRLPPCNKVGILTLAGRRICPVGPQEATARRRARVR